MAYVGNELLEGDRLNNDIEWDVVLNNLEREYSINCDHGTYMLMSESDSDIDGVWIHKSSDDLNKFCDKKYL